MGVSVGAEEQEAKWGAGERQKLMHGWMEGDKIIKVRELNKGGEEGAVTYYSKLASR